MIYRDVYFYTKRSNFETHLSKLFLLVQIHNLELFILGDPGADKGGRSGF